MPVAVVHTDSKITKIDIAKFDTNLKKEFDKLKSSSSQINIYLLTMNLTPPEAVRL